MKKLFYSIILLLFSAAAFSQSGTFNPITGKTDFKDSLKFTKYGNSGALDSVLTVDPITKKLKFIKNNGGAPVSYQGVDSVKYDTATKTMCVYSYGIGNCFVITTNAPATNTGVDSVRVNGSQLCTYTGGVATCYTVNQTINNNQFITNQITNIIDSSIVVNYFNTFYGVDSVKYDTATQLLCVYTFGTPTCYMITTNAPPISTGVDSVVVSGNQICQYTGGVATCYTVTNTINQYITNIIDSSITVINNPTCTPKYSGSVVVDSLYVGRNTDIYFQINCVDYFAAASQFNIVNGGGSPFYVGIYADTAGNIGQVVGNTNPLEIPSLLDPQSQILLKVYYIDPTQDTPTGTGTTWVYREGDDAYWLDSAGTVSSSFDSVNTLNPFAGVHSLRISAMTAGQYFTWQDGATHTSTEFTDFSAQLRISAVLLKSVKWSITLYNGNSLATSNSVIITDGQYGYSRSAAGGYQFISFPMSQFNFISNTFDKVRITFLGTANVAHQWDDVRFQADALPVNTGNFVESVRGVFGKNVEFAVGDTLELSGDSSYYYLKDKRTGLTLASAATLLTYLRSADTCLIIDTIDAKNFTIAFNPFCAGSGGTGGSGITELGTSTTLDKTNDSTYEVNSTIARQQALIDTAAAIRADFPVGGGTTSIQTQNVSGGAVTFTSVPATYADYEIYRNGVRNYPVTDYTTSGNVVTGALWVDGDEIIMQRIK